MHPYVSQKLLLELLDLLDLLDDFSSADNATDVNCLTTKILQIRETWIKGSHAACGHESYSPLNCHEALFSFFTFQLSIVGFQNVP